MVASDFLVLRGIAVLTGVVGGIFIVLVCSCRVEIFSNCQFEGEKVGLVMMSFLSFTRVPD
jgi:hypothetical protein